MMIITNKEIKNNTDVIKVFSKYFSEIFIEKAKALNGKKLKYIEHSIIAGMRIILALNSIGIREFLRNKIKKLNLQNLCLFEKLKNPYEILGKL